MNLVRRTIFLALASVVACSVLAGNASAQKGTKKAAGPNDAIIADLRAAIATLKQADHDYKGHRVNAIHEIHKAVKALVPGKHPRPKIPEGSGNLPQDVSDGLLTKARDSLKTIQTQLNTAGPGNRAAAIAAIQNAISELDTALKIK
jgi:hypothetical protein